ncbi:MAG: hypothetical protein ACO1SV_27685 [Fimbriimonas sp.]
MGHRRLRITLNHAQRRVKRPRIGVTARGVDFEEGGGLIVCPATNAVRLIANFEKPEFQTSNSGAYGKLAVGDFAFTDENATPAPGGSDPPLWSPFEYSAGLKYITFNYENVAGVAGLTNEVYSPDQGMAVGFFAYSPGNEQDGILGELGWNSVPNGDAGPSLRVYFDGHVELWHDGEFQDRGSLSGTAGYGRAAQEYVLLTLERGQGRDLVLRSSTGGAVTFRCNWVDPEDDASFLFPATKFWFRVPKGKATVMVCPIVYDASGTGDTRKYHMAEAPGAGETPQTWVGSDRFPLVSGAHIVGHPQGGAATVALRSEDGATAFSPDGYAQICRVRLTLTSGLGGITTPWIWGVHMAYREIVAFTSDEEMDLGPYLATPVRLTLPDSSQGLDASWEATYLDALELAAPHCLDGEGTPVRLAFVDPDDIDPAIVMLDGELLPPVESDSVRRSSGRATMRAVDRLAAARASKVREALPFDGMPFCRPATDGISAVLLCLREMGIDDSETDLPDLNYRMPDVPMPGTDRSPTGEWNCAALAGDLWGNVLERLWDRAPNVVWGMRPMPGGGYGFHAFEPQPTDPPLAMLFRSVAAAQVADSGLTDAEASRLLYDGATREALPLEGNEVRVMGYDPGRRAPIAAVAIWEESADPTTPAASRFPGWIGRRRGVEFSDPGLTKIEECARVCEQLFTAVTTNLELVPYVAELPFAADGIPVWRGELVRLDDAFGKGDPYDVRTAAWQVELQDESGQGHLAGSELPPSRIANVSGGAILGYGGASSWEIVDLAKDRAKSPRRFRGWQLIDGVSPSGVVVLS